MKFFGLGNKIDSKKQFQSNFFIKKAIFRQLKFIEKNEFLYEIKKQT